MQTNVLVVAILCVMLTACSTCTLCYEDAWSRTPFPGQSTQHLPPLPDPQR